ncbi:MAG: S41 family peptidase [Ferruginibacter sp.]
MEFKTLAIYVVLALSFVACKKNKQDVMVNQPVSTPVTTLTDDVLKDSVLLLTKDIYLWNTQVPSTFNARSFDDPAQIMQGIRQYSMEPGFPTPVDRFSFAIKKTEWDNLSEGLNSLENAASANGDFGFTVFFKAEGDLRVRLVEPNSPAGTAGIHRGWRITKINGNSNISTVNSNFIVDNLYSASTTSVTFQKSDGSVVTIDLKQSHYAIKPVYLDTVYSINNKKIGYLVFNSFLGNVNQLYSDFQRVFNRFAGARIGDVIIDLRYNGGGYVSVQEKLADYLVNTSANGGIMMKEVYNANNSGNNVTTKFNKAGSLNLSRIYFIVGKGTASASELLINNLKPYMDVKLIGGTTYGKPVGFFPIPAGGWYIFPVSFRSFNKNGEGNYFNGMPANSNVADGLDKDWGDLTETSLASAIRYITTGAFRLQTQQEYVAPASVISGNQILGAPLMKLTIGAAPHR